MYEDTCAEKIAKLLLFCLLIAVLMGACFLSWLYIPMPHILTPLEVYQRAYDECMIEETIAPDYCHDLAARAAYPEK